LYKGFFGILHPEKAPKTEKDHTMKKKLVLAFCLFSFVVSTGFSQEAEGGPSGLSGELQLTLDFYRNAGTWNEKLEILQDVVQEAPAGVEGFYANVLKSMLTTYSSIKDMQDLTAADSIAKITVEKLGEAKYTAAAADVNKTIATVKNSVVRSISMIALGQMQAKEYLPQIIQILEDTNIRPALQNRQSYEQLAYGAIVALDHFGDESGYLPVFFAARGWYDDWVKSQARQTLPKISAEPWDLLISVIKGTGYSIGNKRDALQALDESSAENGKKSEAANAALTQSWGITAKDNLDYENLKDIRKISIGMLGKYGAGDDSGYSLLERTFNRGDIDEKRAVINALAALADSQAVAILSRLLQVINVKRADNILTNSDWIIAQAIIIALGKTGNNEARPALSSVLNYGWTNAIKNLARANLQKIQ
jgi:HEAT repeat protein